MWPSISAGFMPSARYDFSSRSSSAPPMMTPSLAPCPMFFSVSAVRSPTSMRLPSCLCCPCHSPPSGAPPLSLLTPAFAVWLIAAITAARSISSGISSARSRAACEPRRQPSFQPSSHIAGSNAAMPDSNRPCMPVCRLFSAMARPIWRKKFGFAAVRAMIAACSAALPALNRPLTILPAYQVVPAVTAPMIVSRAIAWSPSLPRLLSVPWIASFVSCDPADAVPAVIAAIRMVASGPVAVPAVRIVTTAVTIRATTVDAIVATCDFASRNAPSFAWNRPLASAIFACSAASMLP